jgi:hypothetical protein
VQHGLAYYPSLLILKVLKTFNFSVFHVQFVFYAPYHTHTSKQWNKIRKKPPNSNNIRKQRHKAVLLIDMMVWIYTMLKIELRRVLYG